MVIKGFNLEEVKQFQNKIGKLKCKLKYDIDYRNDIVSHGINYNYIKEYFQIISSHLRYTEEIDITSFYRIRKIDTCGR